MRASLVAAATSATMSLLWVCAPAIGSDATWEANADRGKRLAERLCAGCHLVDSATTRGTVAGVPSFKTLANAPGHTEASIKNTLIKPHSPMPDTQLTMHEIGDLLAYIDTLRESSKPDPGDQNTRPKPVYPSPS